MNRYKFTNEGTRFDGKRVYGSLIIPPIAIDTNDIYITSNETTYLDTLAHSYYGDISMWWIIASANNLGNGRLSVTPGKQLRIPMNITKILNDVKKLNS
jgi:hypothetical protein